MSTLAYETNIYLVAFKHTMLRIMEQLVSKILALYVPKAYKAYESEVRDFFKELLRLVEARGLAWTVAYVKLSRNAVMRVISGRPLEKVDGLSLEDGWPVWLSNFRVAVYHPDSLRLLMTLLVVLRGVKLKAVLDLNPITEPWKGTDPIKEGELRFAARQLGIHQRSVEWKRFHMSTKRGPIGQALLTAVTELTLLPQELIDDIRLLGGDKLGELIDHLQKPLFGGYSLVDIWSRLFPARRTSIRKISYFSDKEGKTRVIAILDYWSQTCLRPLHDTLNQVLRKIRTDCTFNQNHFLTCLPSIGPYYSIDLSNATDRMPVALQQRVVSMVIGEARAAAWVRVLTRYEYTPTGHPVPVKYGAGQPMGAYSSWCAMALTHHVLVKVAASRAGYPHFWKYALLGDDLVIANAAVAREYRALLQVLDMPVSEAKTHVSEDTYEFAKRWIHAGHEVTGFSVSGLKEVWKRYSLLHSFLQSQLHHGWNLPTSKHPDLISAIYSIYGRPQHAERATKLYMVFDSVAIAKTTGAFSSILLRIQEWFPGRLEAWNLGAFAPQGLNETAKAVLVEAKSRLVKRDVEKFQVDAYTVNDRLNTDFERVCKDLGLSGLSGQEYRASLRVCHPMVVVLNYLIDGSLPLIMTMFDPEADLTDFYLEAGLSKYHVSKGVFSMRASHSINLAQSMVVKSILDVCKDAKFSRGSALMPRP